MDGMVHIPYLLQVLDLRHRRGTGSVEHPSTSRPRGRDFVRAGRRLKGQGGSRYPPGLDRPQQQPFVHNDAVPRRQSGYDTKKLGSVAAAERRA